MNYYPIYLDLRGRCCVLVGGGTVAARKARSLIDAGAILTVISPSIVPAIEELVHVNAVKYLRKVFAEPDIEGAFLAIAATDDPEVNDAVAAACRVRNILVNTATDAEASTFIVPSVVARGRLLIAVSTSGSSPALARRIREDLERAYGQEYAIFLEKMALLRTRLLRDMVDETVRKRVFRGIVDSDVLDLLREDADELAERRIEEIVKAVAG